EEFRDGFGEDLRQTLDLDTWLPGVDLAATYARLEAEVRDAVAQEDALHRRIRAQVFPQLAAYPGAPSGAGVYRAEGADLRRIHRALADWPWQPRPLRVDHRLGQPGPDDRGHQGHPRPGRRPPPLPLCHQRARRPAHPQPWSGPPPPGVRRRPLAAGADREDHRE